MKAYLVAGSHGWEISISNSASPRSLQLGKRSIQTKNELQHAHQGGGVGRAEGVLPGVHQRGSRTREHSAAAGLWVGPCPEVVALHFHAVSQQPVMWICEEGCSGQHSSLWA